MKKKRLYLIFILICITSCVYTKITHLSNEDLKWLSAYEKGDTVCFISHNCGIDTLFITDKEINNSNFPFIENEASFEYTANGSYTYKMIHKGEIYNGILLLVRKVDNDKKASISFSLCGYYSDMFSPKEIEQVIGRKIITDCIIINSSNAHNGLYQKNIGIRKVIWSKSKGILEFETDEDSWRLEKI